MNLLAGLLSIGINIANDSGVPSAARREPGGPSDAQLAAAERARRVLAYRSATNAGAKYKLNQADKELIGIQDAVLFWASESGVDNSTDDDGNSGLHLTTFDTTTRADSAKIDLLNDSGSVQYVVAAAIKAKPVIRLSGEQGFVHDSFVDYNDIFLSGENLFEFGNNFIVTKAQLEQLADYYAKALGVIVGDSAAIRSKHIYSVTFAGRGWHFEPGEWYTLQIGGAGQREYIDAVCECYGVQVEAPADGLGTTRVDFREVEQNWVKDSNAVARFLATGDPRWKPNNFGRVVVAAKDYLGVADYYCDGTADQTEIQAAIDYLANAFGGGAVVLTEGQFNITAALEMKDNILLRGAGGRTIIEKNCDDHGVEFVGTSGDYIINAEIGDLQITANDADSNASKNLIHIDYARNCLIRNCLIHNSYNDGIYINTAENITIARSSIYGNKNDGISGTGTSINTIVIESEIYENIEFGIYLDYAERGTVSNNYIHDNWRNGIRTVNASRFDISNNRCVNNASNILTYRGTNISVSAITAMSAIYLSGGTSQHVANNQCFDNGTMIDDGDCEFATPPIINGEASNTLTNCTYARSDVQEWAGSYSYLLTKTIAAGTAATAYITDNANTNDMHELYAGQEYTFSCWVYIPSGGMLGSELSLVIRDYVAAWEEQAQACANTYDAWQYVEVTKTLRAASIGVTFGFSVAAAAADTETAHTDNLRLLPLGIKNLHNQQLVNSGTNTYTGV